MNNNPDDGQCRSAKRNRQDSAGQTGQESTQGQAPERTVQSPQTVPRGRRQRLLAYLRPAIVLTLVMTLLVGIGYPLVITGAAQVLFNNQANGSLVTKNGQTVGSSLIGQEWTNPKYFHGRPSATLSDNGSQSQPYNAANSGASNYGPTSKQLQAQVQAELKLLKEDEQLNPGVPIPIDLVTSSGSGLDPDISVAGAMYQAPRIAQERGLSLEQVKQLIQNHIHGRTLGVLGEPYVNVLELNLALGGSA
jgi:K+-transporting ATPase ATPase C chain